MFLMLEVVIRVRMSAVVVAIGAPGDGKNRERTTRARPNGLIERMSHNHRQQVACDLELPVKHKNACVRAEAVDRDLGFHPCVSVEPNVAGKKPPTVLVSIDWIEVGNRRTLINRQQRIERTPNRAKP